MGDKGSDYPLKNHKNIGFLSNSSPDPLQKHKATNPAFNSGPTPAPAGGQKMTLLSLPYQLKKVVKVLDPSDKPFWIRACYCTYVNHLLLNQ